MTGAPAPVPLRRIAVGVDFSARSREAATWVRTNAGAVDVVLVHAVNVPPPPSFTGADLAARDRALGILRSNAEQQLAALAAALPDGATSRRVVTGKPADALLRAAVDGGADIIVVGEHGQRAGVARLLGSTAEQVLHTSAAPVLLARRLPDGPPRRVVVPVDDSDMAPAVLHWARVVCSHFNASALLLHVVDPDLVSAVGIAASASELRRARGNLRRASHKWLTDLARPFVEQGIETRLEVAFGDPSTRIVRRSRPVSADLVIIGRRGAGRVQRALFGSVTDRVLRVAKAPVLVVPEPRD